VRLLHASACCKDAVHKQSVGGGHRVRHLAAFRCVAAHFCLVLFSHWVTPLAHAATVPGTIPGSVEVTLSGSATYAIPIRIAPGTAGTDPKISLNYDSQATAGSLGAGWSIGGISTIARGPKDLYRDHEVAGVNLDDTDALLLDGQRLIEISRVGVGSALRVEYRKENDDVTRIVQTGDGLQSGTFIVNTKGGATLVFDGANNSRVRFSDGTVLLLAISRIVDTSGNYVEFRYQNNGFGTYDIKTIAYTGHETRNSLGAVVADRKPYASVDFAYESAPRESTLYVAGRLSRQTTRLISITSSVSPKPEDESGRQLVQVARYQLDYEERATANRTILVRVRQFGENDDELKPTEFRYTAPAFGWKAASSQLPIVGGFIGQTQLARAFAFTPFGAPVTGVPDLLFAAQIGGQLEAHAFRNESGTWREVESFEPPFPFVAEDGRDLGVALVDLDGDGRTDLIQSNKVGEKDAVGATVLARDAGWEQADPYKIPFALSVDGKRLETYRFAKLSGAAGPDLLFQTADDSGFLVNTGTGWQRDDAHAAPVPLTAGVRLLDVDCDGTPELAAPVAEEQALSGWKIFRFEQDGWQEETRAQFKPPVPSSTPAAGILEIDLNGDDCRDLLASAGATRQAFSASAKGWHELPEKAPPFDLVDASGQGVGARAVDVDGDGLVDVLANRATEGGSPLTYAYRQTGGGWEMLPASFVPSMSLADDQTSDPAGSSNVFIGDLDGDHRADIAQPTGAREGFGQVFNGTTAGFELAPQFAPPVVISRKNDQDGGIRFADFNADGLPDVTFRRDVAKDGKTESTSGAYLNTGKGWSPAPGLIPQVPLASETIAGNPAEFVDLDGDGYTDLLYAYRAADGTITGAFYRNEADGVSGRKLTEQPNSQFKLPPDHQFAAEHLGDLGVRLVDLNGDGRVDILVGRLSVSSTVNPTNGVASHTCAPDAGSAPSKPPAGEQPPQICTLNRTNMVATAFLNNGAGWDSAPDYASPLPFVAVSSRPRAPSRLLFVAIVDVNGDSLPDLVSSFKHPGDPGYTVQETWLNTGKGWSRSKFMEAPIRLDEPLTTPRVSLTWIDVNGDGLTDLVKTARRGQTNDSATWLSTGRGFELSETWKVPLAAIADGTGGDSGYRLADVNGDGYVDILYSRTNSKGEVERGLYTNDGSGWSPTEMPGVFVTPPFSNGVGDDLGVRLVDVDGNGLVDVVKSYASAAAGAPATQAALLNEARRADVLASVSTGYGATTTIEYQTLMESPHSPASSPEAPWPRIYEPGRPAQYPIVSPVPAAYVVRRVTADEGGDRAISSYYRYGHFRIHARAMRSLGFGWRESYNPASETLMRLESVQDPVIGNKIAREATCWLKLAQRPVADALLDNFCPHDANTATQWIRLLSETTSSWKPKRIAVDRGALPALSIWQVFLTTTTSNIFETDGTRVSWQTDTIEYDHPDDALPSRLNVVRTLTERGDGTSIEAVSDYQQDNAEKWYFGRLTRVTRTELGDLARAPAEDRKREQRIVAFTYSPETGLLESETINVGTPYAVTIHHVRDEFGNVVETHRTAIGQVRRSVMTDFDELGRFAQSSTNALGQKTVLRPRLTTGQAESIVDPQGLETRFDYDAFGRERTRTSPSGAVTFTRHVDGDVYAEKAALEGLRAAYVIETRVDSFPSTVAVFSSQGRLLREVTEAFTRDAKISRRIHRDLEYDVLGRTIRSSAPYERGGTKRWTITAYDVLGRVVSTKTASGAETRAAFAGRAGGGRVTTHINARSQKTVTTINMRGLPVSVTDAYGGIVRYTYEAGNRLDTIVGPTGAVTKYKYNAGGFREQIDDPDMGTWTYEYNGFGEVTRQIDAKRQVTTADYDVLGRLKRRVEGGVTTNWDYDTAPYGIGEIAAIHRSDGYRKEFYYDHLGRGVGSSLVVAGEQFVTRSEIDKYGRVTKIFYPNDGVTSAFVVTNIYDDKGFLKQVTDAANGQVLWELRSTDALGHATGERFANGVQTTRVFGATTGLLRRATSSAGAGHIQDLGFEYDTLGRLKTRSDASRGILERFTYDDLDRIKSVTRADGAKEVFSYDSAGRIVQKTGAGSFSYKRPAGSDATAWRPYHAIQATTLDGVVSTYRYDPNGNRENLGPAALQYTADNRLKRIYETDTRWSTFDYGPDGSRYRQYRRDGLAAEETIYFGSYERVTEFAGIVAGQQRKRLQRHRYYVSNGAAAFAVVETNVQYLAPLFDNSGVDGAGTVAKRHVWYMHVDNLGSIQSVTDENARLAARFWFDPWGQRTADVRDPRSGAPGDGLGDSWSRGFTSHEHLEQAQLVHMNGRVYDPFIGSFLSADPVAIHIGYTQTLNRYAYAMNNPLVYIDPTGYGHFDLGKALAGGAAGFLVGGPGGAAAGFIIGGSDDVRDFVEDNWRTVVIVGVAVGVTVATGGAAAGVTGAILSGMATGAATGAASAVLYGGSFNDALNSAGRGAFYGSVSGAAFYGAGSAFMGSAGSATSPDSFGAVAAHGVVGGGVESFEGGKFWSGFTSAALTKASSVYGPQFTSEGANMGRAAVVGGTVAAATGGKFANGAVTGLSSYVFNDMAHRAMWMARWGAVGGVAAAVGAGGLSVATGGINIAATPAEVGAGVAAGAAFGSWLYDMVYSDGGPVVPDFDFNDPARPPIWPGGRESEWSGPGPIGSKEGAWVNPDNRGQSIKDNLDHRPPIGPHWDLNDRGCRPSRYRCFPDGSVKPK
jgi:RHS repeat-associated protein